MTIFSKLRRQLALVFLAASVLCLGVSAQRSHSRKAVAQPAAKSVAKSPTKGKAKAIAAKSSSKKAVPGARTIKLGRNGKAAIPSKKEAAQQRKRMSHANARTAVSRREPPAERGRLSIRLVRTPPPPPARTYAARPVPAPLPEPAYTAPAVPAIVAPVVATDAAVPASTGPVTPHGSPFLYASRLAPFFSALAAHQQGGANAPDTIRILQFGDSHTAADIFTGAVRAAMQAHFGDGGLGFQYPGHPFPGYHLAGSSRSQSSGWVTEGNHFSTLGDGDLGLGGISIATYRPRETVSVSTTCTTFQLHYLRQPGGGRLRFTDNGTFVSDIDTSGRAEPAATPDDSGLLPAPAAASTSAGTFTYACTGGQHDLTVTTLDAAPVKLFGLVTEQPGITYECLGLNGAVAPLMLRWNQRLFAEYLRERDPTLIVLAYGTNEAAQGANTNDTYVAQFNRLIDSLHRYAPAAAILVLGPYDRATRIGSRRRSYLATWPGTARIIADQIESCRVHGCTFYNQQARMGGPGSMIRWASSGLAQPDHTHLTGTGYRELAKALYDDLLGAYTSYQASSGGSAASAGTSAHNR